jgi:HPt (histidine-containing phosphotransfer) domain-containing protein
LQVQKNGPINVAKVLAGLNGDERLLQELWEVFLEDAPRQLQLLKVALDSKDQEHLERLALGLKAAAGKIGAETLQNEAFSMELVARKGSLTTARDLYNSLASEMEQVLTALPPLVARGGEAQEVEGCG